MLCYATRCICAREGDILGDVENMEALCSRASRQDSYMRYRFLVA